jgi:hypothetical protein
VKAKLGLTHTKEQVRKNFPFGSVVDGITFGIVDSKPFDTANPDWTTKAKKRWAEGNAIYFETLAKNLRNWGSLQQ